MTKRKVYGDTDCLSSFLLLDEVSLLESLLDEVVIPKAVYQELRANGTPLQIVENLEHLKNKKFIRVHDMDVHLTTDIVRLIRAVKCRDGQYKIDCQGEVDQYDCCLFPVDSHSSNDYLLAFSFSILAISGT